MDIKEIIEDAIASGADLIDAGERLDQLYQGERTLYPHYLFSEKELTKLVELTLKRASGDNSVDVSFITDEHLKDLSRFNETAEDDNSYDLPKIRMLALAKSGLVSHTSRGIYMITDFGAAMLEASKLPNNFKSWVKEFKLKHEEWRYADTESLMRNAYDAGRFQLSNQSLSENEQNAINAERYRYLKENYVMANFNIYDDEDFSNGQTGLIIEVPNGIDINRDLDLVVDQAIANKKGGV